MRIKFVGFRKLLRRRRRKTSDSPLRRGTMERISDRGARRRPSKRTFRFDWQPDLYERLPICAENCDPKTWCDDVSKWLFDLERDPDSEIEIETKTFLKLSGELHVCVDRIYDLRAGGLGDERRLREIVDSAIALAWAVHRYVRGIFFANPLRMRDYGRVEGFVGCWHAFCRMHYLKTISGPRKEPGGNLSHRRFAVKVRAASLGFAVYGRAPETMGITALWENLKSFVDKSYAFSFSTDAYVYFRELVELYERATAIETDSSLFDNLVYCFRGRPANDDAQPDGGEVSRASVVYCDDARSYGLNLCYLLDGEMLIYNQLLRYRTLSALLVRSRTGNATKTIPSEPAFATTACRAVSGFLKNLYCGFADSLFKREATDKFKFGLYGCGLYAGEAERTKYLTKNTDPSDEKICSESRAARYQSLRKDFSSRTTISYFDDYEVDESKRLTAIEKSQAPPAAAAEEPDRFPVDARLEAYGQVPLSPLESLMRHAAFVAFERTFASDRELYPFALNSVWHFERHDNFAEIENAIDLLPPLPQLIGLCQLFFLFDSKGRIVYVSACLYESIIIWFALALMDRKLKADAVPDDMIAAVERTVASFLPD